MELLECNGINDYAIELEKSKQLFFGPIYSLGPVKFEILKTYVETNLANSLIRPSKSLAGVSIFIDLKLHESFYFYIDYWGLINITMKN